MDTIQSPSDEDVIKADEEFSMDVSDSVIPNAYKSYVQSIRAFPIYTPEEEKKILARYYETKDVSLRNEIASHNLRLVINVAKHYVGSGVDFEDLISEGNLGLLKGIECFDPTKGFKLSTYSVWWIRQAITRYLSNYGRTIRLPVHINEKFYKMRKFIREYSNEHGVKPNREEIMSACDIGEETYKYYTLYSEEVASLDTPVGADDGDKDTSLGDFISDDGLNPEQVAMKSALRSAVEQELDCLTPKQEDVIRKRFGFNAEDKCYTLEEVAHGYGCTRERIRQIEAGALRTLRSPKHTSNLRDFKEVR